MPIQASLKSVAFLDPDASSDLWSPSNPLDFGLEGMAFIGPKDSDTSDVFDIAVCTPLWLHNQMMQAPPPPDHRRHPLGWYWFENGHILLGRGVFLVSRWNRQEVFSAINQIVEPVSGSSWDDVGRKLDKFLMWEHADS